jgi:hypothetical protein
VYISVIFSSCVADGWPETTEGSDLIPS